jgi:hypothetical protein
MALLTIMSMTALMNWDVNGMLDGLDDCDVHDGLDDFDDSDVHGGLFDCDICGVMTDV